MGATRPMYLSQLLSFGEPQPSSDGAAGNTFYVAGHACIPAGVDSPTRAQNRNDYWEDP